jgi:hypothetical protein
MDDEFVEIIQNINLYTDTKSNVLFNTSMIFAKDPDVLPHPEPGKKLYYYTSIPLPNKQRMHFPCEKFITIYGVCSAPETIELTLLVAALEASGYKFSKSLEALMSHDINFNVTVLNNSGEMQPILNCLLFLNNDLNWIARLLSHSNPNSYDDRGVPVLLFAATRLGIDKVKLLLDFGANPAALSYYKPPNSDHRIIGNMLSQVICEPRIDDDRSIELIKLFVGRVAYEQGSAKALKMIDNNFRYEVNIEKEQSRTTVIKVSGKEVREMKKMGITDKQQIKDYLGPSNSTGGKTAKETICGKKPNSEFAVLGISKNFH